MSHPEYWGAKPSAAAAFGAPPSRRQNAGLPPRTAQGSHVRFRVPLAAWKAALPVHPVAPPHDGWRDLLSKIRDDPCLGHAALIDRVDIRRGGAKANRRRHLLQLGNFRFGLA